MSIVFSVIIPCYNASSDIARTLDSLLLQTFNDFEVLIIDDASDDFDILSKIIAKKKYESLDVKVLQHTVNKNGAAARNTGIVNALGKYIAFLDADDEWYEKKLELYYKVLSSSDENLLLYSKLYLSKDNGDFFSKPNSRIKKHEDMSEYLFLRGGFIQTSTICLSTISARKIMFDERFKRHQDYDFCLRAYYFGLKIEMIDKVLTIYHVHGNIYKSKNEDIKYCLWWLENMKPYMSSKGYWGYMFFNISGRLYISKKWGELFFNVIHSALMLGPFGLFKSIDKFKYVLKSIIREG